MLNIHGVSHDGPMIVSILSNILAVNHVEALESFAGSLASAEPELAVKREKYLKEVADVLNLLEAQQTSLEIVANLCSGDGGYYKF